MHGNTRHFEYSQQALSILREVGNCRSEAVTMSSRGFLARAQHYFDFAFATWLIAIQHFKEDSSPRQNEVERWIDYLRQAIGPQQFAALQEFVELRLQQMVEQGLRVKRAQHEEE
jgi:hypothetical protein